MIYGDFAPDAAAESRIADVARRLLRLDADHYILEEAPPGLEALAEADDAHVARALFDDEALSAYHFVLLEAVRADCTELIALRIARAAAGPLTRLDEKAYGPELFLIEAAIHGAVSAIERFVEAGVDVNYRHVDGQNDMTALHWAAYQRKEGAVAALLAAPGIDLTVLDKRRTMPFACAFRHGMSSMVRRFLDAGADANDAGPGSESPLALAIRTYDPELLQLLLDAGAELNTTDRKSGITPIQLACHLRQAGLVERLRAAGADPNVPSRKKFKKIPGKSTAYEFAAGLADVEAALGPPPN